MREELRAFAGRVAGADIAIVYYAGHGIEVAGENYLVPVDAKLGRDRDLDYEAVTLASVLNVVSEARKLKLVILDACRNNPLADKIALRAGVTREASRGLVRIAVSLSPRTADLAARFNSAGRGNPVGVGGGPTRAVCCSCEAAVTKFCADPLDQCHESHASFC